MPANARFNIGPFELFVGRTTDVTLDLYGPDAETPLVIATADGVEARLWDTDGASPDFTTNKAGTDSKVTVVDEGVAGTTPARVTVRFHETQTNALAAGRYNFELFLEDDSDSDLKKPLCRGTAVVKGSPSA